MTSRRTDPGTVVASAVSPRFTFSLHSNGMIAKYNHVFHWNLHVLISSAWGRVR